MSVTFNKFKSIEIELFEELRLLTSEYFDGSYELRFGIMESKVEKFLNRNIDKFLAKIFNLMKRDDFNWNFKFLLKVHIFIKKINLSSYLKVTRITQK